MLFHILFLFFFINLIDLSITERQKSINIKCSDLLVGQYRCQQPKIDDQTQEPQSCERHHLILNGEEKFIDTAPISCYTAPKIICDGGIYNETIDGYIFEKRTSCRWTNGKYYRTTLILSLFLVLHNENDKK
ncbi:unnamed protein product [Rotaria sp. Silwood1]|nr:unnamed protein product [Rotaria sp. Silwood1]CAF4839561.1 unnamed protein product [Rotaria sp. Silwood1]